MTLRKEDPTKIKRWRKLTIGEVSTVDRGGSGDGRDETRAKILIVRDNKESNVPEQKVTFADRILSLFRNAPEKAERGHDEDSPLTTSEILAQRQMMEKCGRVEDAFQTSMYRILYGCKGKDQMDKLKRTVNEFAEEMDKCLGSDGVKRDENIERIGASLTEVATVLAQAEKQDEMQKDQIERIERVLDPKNKPADLADGGDTKKETTMTVKIEDVLRKLSAEERAAIEAELKKDAPAADPVETIKRNADKVPDEVKAALDAIVRRDEERAAELTTLKAASANLVESVKRLEKDRQDADLAAKAKEFEGVAPADKIISVLRSGNEDALEVLRAAKARLAASALMTEVGEAGTFSRQAPAEGSAEQEIERKATELLQKDSDGKFMGSAGQARAEVRRMFPDLARRERDGL